VVIARITAELRELAVCLAMVLLALATASALVGVAVVLGCLGLAGMLGSLLGGRLWAGDLLTAILALGFSVAAARVAAAQIRTAFARHSQEAYERRRNQVADQLALRSRQPAEPHE
jgi:predicted lipid-binding transport protein (Tim44 family)